MLSEMSPLDMLFKDNTSAAVWGLFGLILLLGLLRLIVLRLSRHRVCSFGDNKISQNISLLSKLPSSKNEADKDHPKNEEAPKAPKTEVNKDAKNEAKARKKRAKKARRRANAFSCTTSNLAPKLDVALRADLLQEVEYYKKMNLFRAGLSRPDLYGMDSYEIKVMEFLDNGTSSLLGISGMSGVGKTTLLRLLRTYYSQHRYFSFVFWAKAGTGFKANILLGILARSIGLDVPAVPGVNFISSFLEGETFLLLLDDVQNSFDLAAAGLPMPLGPRQKVVFTTRDESVCSKMGCAGNIIRMQCLDEDLAWDLFRYNVGHGIIEANPEIDVVAKQICADCGGFPSALSTVGRSMSTKRDVKEWRYARDRFKIQNSPSNEIEEVDREGCPCVRFFEGEF